MEVTGQPHALAALPQTKELTVPTEQDPGWAPQPVQTFRGRVRINKNYYI